jgi:hypothetical protein
MTTIKHEPWPFGEEGRLTVAGESFRDHAGRRVLLRGLNVAGSSKVPLRPRGETHQPEAFYEHRDVSFVDRPFSLDEAVEHLDRLCHWGMLTVRLVVPWEAIEHRGPGCYDEAYLDYIAQLVELMARRGMNVVIDPHQDVWSRFSGGDGAPGWTLEAAGFDLTQLHRTGAAVIHHLAGGSYLAMEWLANGTRLAAATMFTLFFGGHDFAPRARFDGTPLQELLQGCYIAAFQELARRLRPLPNVVGYETMNEPLPGYIGWENLNRPRSLIPLGTEMSPLQSMALGDGLAQRVVRRTWSPRGWPRSQHLWHDPGQARAWQQEVPCLWQDHGVWTVCGGRPEVVEPQYFSHRKGRRLDFIDDYYRPFVRRFAQGIRDADPKATVLVAPPWGAPPPAWPDRNGLPVAYAPHWYDGYVLFLKRYSPWVALNLWSHWPVFTSGAIRRSFRRQLTQLRHDARRYLGPVPLLLGECGIPFDLDQGRAYRTGGFCQQEAALDRTMEAVEAAGLNVTVWNYTPDNSNQWGDNWNGEDLSLFSRDQRTTATLDSGGRALSALVRPYPLATAGEPLRLRFDRRRRRFQFEFRHDPAVTAPTVIFLPKNDTRLTGTNSD